MPRNHTPPVNVVSQGAARCNFLNWGVDTCLWLFAGAGAPVNGTSGDGAGWAGTGSLYVNTVTGGLYSQTGDARVACLDGALI